MDFDSYFSPENVPVDKKYQEAIEDYPADVRKTVQLFSSIWRFPIPSRKSKRFKLWVREAREIQQVCGGEGEVEGPMRELFAEWNKRLHNGNGWDVAGIQSITGMLAQQVAKMRLEASEVEEKRELRA